VRHFLSDIACGADQCLVAWTAVNDAERFGYDIRAARISKSGQLLDMTSIKIASASYLNTTPPQVVALKSDYVVFYSGILYARVSREGIVTGHDLKTSISNGMASVNEAVAVGGSVLMYSVENHGPLVPYVTLLDENLNVLREVKIDGQPTDVAAAGNGFVVASTSVDGLKVTRVSTDGAIVSTSVVPVWNTAAVIAAAADGVLLAWRRPPTNDGPATTEFATITNDGAQHVGILDRSISQSSSLDVASTGSGYLVLWSRPSSGYYTDQLYARRISSNGQILDPSPVVVTTRSPFQIQAKCAALDGRYLAVWSDWRFGSGHDHIFAATVPVNGEIGPDFLVSRLFISQSNAVLATTGTVVAAAWREAAGSGAGAIMFTRARQDGTLLDATPVRFSEVGGNPALTSHADRFIIAWREWGIVRVAIIDAGGQITRAGYVSAPGIGDVSIAAGKDDMIVLCDDNNAIYAAHLRYDGTVVDPNAHTLGSGADPKIAFNGEHYWVVYRSGDGIEARRISSDGSFLDTVPFTMTGAADATQDQLTIACGTRACAALWRSVRGDQHAIEGAMLTTGGAVPGIVAARATDVAQPAIAWNGDAYLLTWSAQEIGEANFDIQAAQLSASGNLVGSPTSITETDNDERSPAVSTAGSTRVYAYSRTSTEAGDRLILRFDDDAPRRRSVRH
ncbi:MAG TPA: hypothetical protein VKL19_12555, partial [Thermoanaerobaculia bacterium]|nr:hypothetical protein [Thermoanaerobaculia bacterium]